VQDAEGIGMTNSHLSAALAALASIPLLLAGCVSVHDVDASDSGGAFRSDVSVVQIVSTNVQGKNVYIPSTIVITSGRRYKLSIFNTTDTPHGFTIDGTAVQTVLEPQKEQLIELPELEAGRIYAIHCQLHPGHRTATLVVLPGAN
jgi:heme/copper-type cytochrome/quinol oxidase subunit 2